MSTGEDAPMAQQPIKSDESFYTLRTLTFGLFNKPGPEKHIELKEYRGASWPIHLVRDDSNQPIFWLDRLLKGGFRVPRDLGHPLRIVVTGRPGLGKSLFVQQLLYSRLFAEYPWGASPPNSTSDLPALDDARSGSGTPDVSSLYVTTEASATAVFANMKSLGWHLVDTGQGRDETAPSRVLELQLDRSASGALPAGASGLHGTLRVEYLPFQIVAQRRAGRTVHSSTRLAEKLEEIMDHRSKPGRLYAIAFDSVNSLPASASGLEAFEGVMSREWEGEHPHLAIFVCDAEAEEESARWAHRADIVIQFKTDELHGYTSHYISIVKARYQDHVMGRHPVVVCGWREPGAPILGNADSMGPRPRLREGGLFVFPNHHFLIDEMKQDDLTPGRPIHGLRFFSPHGREAFVDIPAGYDRDRLPSDARVAMLGQLGAGRRVFMTAMFAEVWLKQVWFRTAGDPNNARRTGGPLLISFGESSGWFNQRVASELRDRIAAVVEEDGTPVAGSKGAVTEAERSRRRWLMLRLREILPSPDESPSDQAMRSSADFLRDQFPMLRQRPGSVLPAAFLNRLTYWLAHRQPSVVAILGLDSLESLFPQLASESQFVPTVVEMLRAHRVVALLPVSPRAGGDAGIARFGLQEHANFVLEFYGPLGKQAQKPVWLKDDKGWSASPQSARPGPPSAAQ